MVITSASNIKCGDNPAYTLDNFLKFYPQFKDIVPDVVANSFLDNAFKPSSEPTFGYTSVLMYFTVVV